MVEENRQAPFNMALYTLESIRKWIDKIAEVSMGVSEGVLLNPNDTIVIKRKMVRQLIVLSAPLLDKIPLENIQEEFAKIKIVTGTINRGGNVSRNVPIYTPEIEESLDSCVEHLEVSLQENGHFMPGSDESSLF